MNELEEHRPHDLRPELNAIETSLALSEEYGALFWGRKLMEQEKVRAILRTLNEEQIRYAIIGAVALGYHAVPRATADIDILVRQEDIPKLQKLFQQYYLRGTAEAMIFDVEGTQIDMLPANLRMKRVAVDNATAIFVYDIPAKVVSLRDLILLKLLAIPERPGLDKRRQDEADVTTLLAHNADKISQAEINYIGSSLLRLAFTPAEVRKYREVIRWLNDTLELLGMADRRYQE